MSNPPKSVQVTFQGIVVSDDLGFGDVNRTFTIRYNRQSPPGVPNYTLSEKQNGFLVQITVALTEPPNNYVGFTITRLSDTTYLQPFSGASPGLVIPNTFTPNGGTATITPNA